jgi:glutathione synthase
MTRSRITVLVNNREQTRERLKTWLLASEALKRGHDVYACGVQDLALESAAGVVVTAQSLAPSDAYEPVIGLSGAKATYALGANDIVLIRTNPGRDTKHSGLHHAALHILRHAQSKKALVLNDPAALLGFATKAYLLDLPREFCPQSLVSADISRLLEYAGALDSPFVVKPLVGSRGQGVFAFENSTDSNLRSVLETLTATGMVLLQTFVPEAKLAEYRVVFVAGEPLRRGRDIVAVCRQASGGDFRNNVHAGASAKSAVLPESFHPAVQGVTALLKLRGIFLAGVDMSGGIVLEINTHSPGGWDGAERSPGEFTRAILNAIEHQLCQQ